MIKKIFTYSIILIILTTSFGKSFAQNGLQLISDSTYGDVLSLRKMDVETDQSGNLWIGYYDAGMGKYTNEELQIFNITNSQLPSNRVNDIFSDYTDNSISISTENGLAILNGNEWSFPGGGLNGYSVESSYKLNNTIYALCSKDEFVDSLAIYDGNNWEFIQIPSFTKSFLNKTPIEFYNDVLYWGTRQEGLFSYDGSQVKHLLYNLSLNDLQVYDDKIWISLGTYTSEHESILIYDPNYGNINNFSSHFAYEPTHTYKNACFSVDGYNLNIIYPFQTQLVCNSITDNKHELFIYPNQTLTNTRLSSTTSVNGKIYVTGWSFLPIMVIDKSLHENFLSGFWSRNIKTLDINQVGATVRSYGSMFWDGNSLPRYQVPIDSNTNSIFASGLWIGGYDQNKQLHLSGVSYGENTESNISLYDFVPGSLYSEGDKQGQGDTLLSNKYDRVWKIDRYDIEQFNYENAKSYIIPDDMEDWPGNGNDGLEILAPYVDQNNDGIYNIEDGDYPQIRGDQMLWWLTNDNTHPNEETGGIPLGVELQHSFYGFKYDHPIDEYTELINYQTYLNIRITNQSTQRYDSVYIGVWVDADIGNAMDDYIGCDVKRNSFYFYNADSYDESSQNFIGYGSNPPVQTVTILNGPLADEDQVDNDLDGIVDNERIKMSKFVYYNNITESSNPAITDPFIDKDYYKYLTGHWKDGSQLCYGGNGHYLGGGNSNIPCDYMFPGETDPEGIGTNGVSQPNWSEVTEQNTPNDRRGLCSMGPFTLEPGEVNEIDILFAFIPNDGTKSGTFNYQPDLDSLITWYQENRTPSNYENAETLGIETLQTTEISIFPNPVDKLCNIRCNEKIISISLFDIKGQKIKELNINKYETILNTENIQSGIYILLCETKNGFIRKKISIL